jgi:hypothetical protein
VQSCKAQMGLFCHRAGLAPLGMMGGTMGWDHHCCSACVQGPPRAMQHATCRELQRHWDQSQVHMQKTMIDRSCSCYLLLLIFCERP